MDPDHDEFSAEAAAGHGGPRAAFSSSADPVHVRSERSHSESERGGRGSASLSFGVGLGARLQADSDLAESEPPRAASASPAPSLVEVRPRGSLQLSAGSGPSPVPSSSALLRPLLSPASPGTVASQAGNSRRGSYVYVLNQMSEALGLKAQGGGEATAKRNVLALLVMTGSPALAIAVQMALPYPLLPPNYARLAVWIFACAPAGMQTCTWFCVCHRIPAWRILPSWLAVYLAVNMCLLLPISVIRDLSTLPFGYSVCAASFLLSNQVNARLHSLALRRLQRARAVAAAARGAPLGLPPGGGLEANLKLFLGFNTTSVFVTLLPILYLLAFSVLESAFGQIGLNVLMSVLTITLIFLIVRRFGDDLAGVLPHGDATVCYVISALFSYRVFRQLAFFRIKNDAVFVASLALEVPPAPAFAETSRQIVTLVFPVSLLFDRLARAFLHRVPRGLYPFRRVSDAPPPLSSAGPAAQPAQRPSQPLAPGRPRAGSLQPYAVPLGRRRSEPVSDSEEAPPPRVAHRAWRSAHAEDPEGSVHGTPAAASAAANPVPLSRLDGGVVHVVGDGESPYPAFSPASLAWGSASGPGSALELHRPSTSSSGVPPGLPGPGDKPKGYSAALAAPRPPASTSTATSGSGSGAGAGAGARRGSWLSAGGAAAPPVRIRVDSEETARPGAAAAGAGASQLQATARTAPSEAVPPRSFQESVGEESVPLKARAPSRSTHPARAALLTESPRRSAQAGASCSDGAAGPDLESGGLSGGGGGGGGGVRLFSLDSLVSDPEAAPRFGAGAAGAAPAPAPVAPLEFEANARGAAARASVSSEGSLGMDAGKAVGATGAPGGYDEREDVQLYHMQSGIRSVVLLQAAVCWSASLVFVVGASIARWGPASHYFPFDPAVCSGETFSKAVAFSLVQALAHGVALLAIQLAGLAFPRLRSRLALTASWRILRERMGVIGLLCVGGTTMAFLALYREANIYSYVHLEDYAPS
eukprot:tig00000058_g746.t1